MQHFDVEKTRRQATPRALDGPIEVCEPRTKAWSFSVFVCIVTIGSRGDAQPCVALGAALAERGHRVRLVAPDAFASMAATHPIEFTPLGIDVHSEAQSKDSRLLFDHGGGFAAYAMWLKRLTAKIAFEATPKVIAAAQGADVIVGASFGEPIAAIAAEHLGAPCVHVWNFPAIASRDFLCSLTPPLPFSLPGRLNSAVFALGDRLVWLLVRGFMQDIRAGLGMRPAGFVSPLRQAADGGAPVLLPYSPALLPRSREWKSNIEVTGFWRLGHAPDWKPSDALAHFLAAGDPPIYVGFGSMQVADREAALTMLLNAVEMAKVRAIIATGWSNVQPTDGGRDVHFINDAPHDWLFDRVAAVVHHGGAGTTGAALAAGKPSIVSPFILDQFFWADLLHKRGVAPAVTPFARLTSDKLARAIRAALDDARMRERAHELGFAVRAEDGVSRAVAVIEAASPRA